MLDLRKLDLNFLHCLGSFLGPRRGVSNFVFMIS
jgi:hypothetical protein